MIDAHFHLFPPVDFKIEGVLDGQMGVTAEEAARLLDVAGVEKAVIFGLPCPEAFSLEDGNRYVMEAARAYPDRLVPVAMIDDRIEHWLAEGARGAKEHVYTQRRLRSSKRLLDGFADLSQWREQYRAVARAGVPLILHGGLDVVRRVLWMQGLAPGLRVVLAHLGWSFEPQAGNGGRATWEELRPVLEALVEAEGVFFDLSALWCGVEERRVIREALALLGPGRVMWGSDYPTDNMKPHMALGYLAGVGLTREQMEDLDRTARKVWGI